jgi:catechol 2,3-dioxygenase-like lactoylglutathione lyase family enzyme
MTGCGSKEETVMLEKAQAVATIAVRDTKSAREFYEKKLGLTRDRGAEPGVLSYKAGNSSLLVYESQYAGTNKATAATFVVTDVDRTVSDLKTRGIAFEHYDLPQMHREGDVHVAGGMRAAWFKDPDGNILSVVNG